MKTPKPPFPSRFLCKYLRNKEMFYEENGFNDEDPTASGVYWCAKTQEAFGPDNEPAGKAECCANRGCYIS